MYKLGMSFEFESNSCSTRTLPVRRTANNLGCSRQVRVYFGTQLKSMGLERLKSKVLILKANMQVIVIKSVWGPGSCPRGHVSMQKNVLKPAFFWGPRGSV